jgi:hypothetical protein
MHVLLGAPIESGGRDAGPIVRTGSSEAQGAVAAVRATMRVWEIAHEQFV